MAKRDGSESIQPISAPVPDSWLITRLLGQLGYAAGEIARRPLSYLRDALLPDSLTRALPGRLLREAGGAGAALLNHPLTFIGGALSPDEIGLKRRRRFLPILAVSVFVHTVFVTYVIYMVLIAPFANVRVVDKGYRQIDIEALLKPLHYPPGMLRGPSGQKQMTLEEIQEREKKRREEAVRREKERKEREEAERRAEEARKAEEEARKQADAKAKEAETKAGSAQFGEVNVAPIKDIIGQVYEMYDAGKLDLELTNFSMMASFKIDPDGSIPVPSIKIIKSSGSKEVDKVGIKVLWLLGESHALGPLAILSSNTIQLEINDNFARLSITAFAPTPDEARAKAEQIRFLLGVVKFAQKSKNPAVYELLNHLTMKADNKRVDAEMKVTRARAAEMMHAQFGKSGTAP